MLNTLNNDQLILELSVGRITFLSFEEKKNLIKKLDSAYSLALLSIEDISSIVNRKFRNDVIWDGKENLHMAQVALQYCERMHIQILLHTDERYPELLRQISDPPYLLYCRGNVECLVQRSVSVVGTRRISQPGKTAAESFAYDAVQNGCNVVSGLANGADGFAHQGAINAFFDYCEQKKDIETLGKTIAVLPSAIDQITPGNHKNMAANIIKSGGCIISEYGPGIGMANWHFVARNRIIAGLSPATVVIEAPAGSGALITAEFALEFGRDVLFHQSAFNTMAQQISAVTKQQLIVEHAVGAVSKYKLENTPERYLESGAPVINDYKDYCMALSEAPGKRSTKPIQGELFNYG